MEHESGRIEDSSWDAANTSLDISDHGFAADTGTPHESETRSLNPRTYNALQLEYRDLPGPPGDLAKAWAQQYREIKQLKAESHDHVTHLQRLESTVVDLKSDLKDTKKVNQYLERRYNEQEDDFSKSNDKMDSLREEAYDLRQKLYQHVDEEKKAKQDLELTRQLNQKLVTNTVQMRKELERQKKFAEELRIASTERARLQLENIVYVAEADRLKLELEFAREQMLLLAEQQKEVEKELFERDEAEGDKMLLLVEQQKGVEEELFERDEAGDDQGVPYNTLEQELGNTSPPSDESSTTSNNHGIDGGLLPRPSTPGLNEGSSTTSSSDGSHRSSSSVPSTLGLTNRSSESSNSNRSRHSPPSVPSTPGLTDRSSESSNSNRSRHKPPSVPNTPGLTDGSSQSSNSDTVSSGQLRGSTAATLAIDDRLDKDDLFDDAMRSWGLVGSSSTEDLILLDPNRDVPVAATKDKAPLPPGQSTMKRKRSVTGSVGNLPALPEGEGHPPSPDTPLPIPKRLFAKKVVQSTGTQVNIQSDELIEEVQLKLSGVQTQAEAAPRISGGQKSRSISTQTGTDLIVNPERAKMWLPSSASTANQTESDDHRQANFTPGNSGNTQSATSSTEDRVAQHDAMSYTDVSPLQKLLDVQTDSMKYESKENQQRGSIRSIAEPIPHIKKVSTEKTSSYRQNDPVLGHTRDPIMPPEKVQLSRQTGIELKAQDRGELASRDSNSAQTGVKSKTDHEQIKTTHQKFPSTTTEWQAPSESGQNSDRVDNVRTQCMSTRGTQTDPGVVPRYPPTELGSEFSSSPEGRYPLSWWSMLLCLLGSCLLMYFSPDDKEFWMRANDLTRQRVIALRDDKWFAPIWLDGLKYSAEKMLFPDRDVFG